MLSRDYRQTARNALRGFWGTSILVTLVATLLGSSGNPFAGAAGGASGGTASSPANSGAYNNIRLDTIPPVILTIIITFLSFLALYAIITLVLGGAVKLGLVSYNIDLITRRKNPVFSTLFSRFNIFGKAFALQFMTSLFISLWTLLFIVPGIIASYRYAMAPYLLSENPNLGVMEALRLSKQMMDGNKLRLFKLHLSFIGWIILAGFTLGIGYLWLAPYTYAAEAAFYLDISNNNAQR